MKKLISFVLIFSALATYAQLPNIYLNKHFGSNLIDFSSNCIATPDSGFLMICNSRINNHDIISTKGNFDAYLCKFNKFGLLQFQKDLGGTNDDNLNSISNAENGNFWLIGGTTSNNGDLPNSSYGKADIWVLKLDKNGNILLSKKYGSNDISNAQDIISDGNGGAYFCAYVSGPASSLMSTPIVGFNDAWVVHIDANGTILWEKILGGKSTSSKSGIEYSIANKLKLIADGNLLVSAYSNCNDTNYFFNTNYDTTKTLDAWLLKFNAQTGNVIWKHNFGTKGKDFFNDFIELTDKSILLIGTTDSVGIDVTQSNGKGEAWMLKLDSMGVKMWDKTFGGTNNDGLNSFLLSKKGTLMMLGSTNSTDVDIVNNHGKIDCFLLETDLNGNKLNINCYGGNNDENPISISESVNGNLLINSTTLSTNSGDCLFANYDTTQMSSYDIWLFGLGTKPFADAIQNLQQDAHQINFSIYPNPINSNSGLFNIQSSSDLNESVISIKNVIGETMYEKHITTSTNKLQIEPTNLTVGIYFIEIKSKEQTQTLKLIKQ